MGSRRFFIGGTPLVEIALANGGVAIIDDADVKNISRFAWRRDSNGYASRSEKDASGRWNTVLMHRVIAEPSAHQVVDHANGNRSDNRRENLRRCTRSQNLANRAGKRRGKKGVQFKPCNGRGFRLQKKWIAQISIRGRTRCLGRFRTAREAAAAYDAAAAAQFGEFAQLNDSRQAVA